MSNADSASMRFFGTSNYASSAVAGDRVRVFIGGSPSPSANIGATDTTIEFWLKGNAADNSTSAPTCGSSGPFAGSDGWIPGHIIIDQDLAGSSSQGIASADWGISLGANTIAYGVRGRAEAGITICSNVGVLNGLWRHVAIQRRVNDGRMWLFVDGALTATGIGASGDKSYPPALITDLPNSDPYTVFGAEKLANFTWPNYRGLLTEVRFSTTLRYGTATTLNAAVFSRPTARFTPDAQTASLWHFSEGSGSVVADAAGNSPAQVRFTVDEAMPAWSTDSPFPAAALCALDIDGNGSTDASTDGVLIVRHLLGLSGGSLISGAIGSGATRDATAIATYIASLDLNADGTALAAPSALTDGLLIYRALAQRSGSALSTAALGTGATRNAQQVIDWIRLTHGASCIP
jgi:hypothetical protein